MASSFSRMARMKSLLFSTVGLGRVVIRARSFVIFPPSMVSMVAFSSLSAKAASYWFPASSPRFLNAPDQAKMVATELVEVASPFRWR